MDLTVEHNKVKFSGILSETSNIKLARETLTQPAEIHKSTGLLFDFSEVKRCNSQGIQSWLKGMREFPCKILYHNVPEWLVVQFNFINEFFSKKLFPNGITVVNFAASYQTLDGSQTLVRYLEVGSEEAPLLEDYFDFEPQSIVVEGVEFEPVYDPGDYFLFMTHLSKSNSAKSA